MSYLQCTMEADANAKKTGQAIDQLVAKSNEVDRTATLLNSWKDDNKEYLEFSLDKSKFVDLITHNDQDGVHDGTDVDKADREWKFNGGAELKGTELVALNPTFVGASFSLSETKITLGLTQYFTYSPSGDHEHLATHTTEADLEVRVEGVVANGGKQVTYTWEHDESAEICVTKEDNEFAKDFVRIDHTDQWTANPNLPTETQGPDTLKACGTLAAKDSYSALMDITANLTSIRISDTQISKAVQQVMEAVTHTSNQSKMREIMKADTTVFKGLTSSLSTAADIEGSVGIHNQTASFETTTGVVVTFV